jgi:hypothetical protein
MELPTAQGYTPVILQRRRYREESTDSQNECAIGKLKLACFA